MLHISISLCAFICCYYCVLCFTCNFYVQFTSIFNSYVIDVRLSCLFLPPWRRRVVGLLIHYEWCNSFVMRLIGSAKFKGGRPWPQTSHQYMASHWTIFIARQHTDARYWYNKSVCLSVPPSVRSSFTKFVNRIFRKRMNRFRCELAGQEHETINFGR